MVAGQRLIQASSDIFLGWQRTQGDLDGKTRDFYVRQLRDWKFSVDIETMVPRDTRMYGELCGWTLARAHARSGDRIAIAAYLRGSDTFHQAITEFAAGYADQNQRDHDALTAPSPPGGSLQNATCNTGGRAPAGLSRARQPCSVTSVATGFTP